MGTPSDVPVQILRPFEVRVLEALLLDGADIETVARRAGVTRDRAKRVLADIAAGYGLSRMEMVVALLRGQVTYREDWWITTRQPKHSEEWRRKKREQQATYRARKRREAVEREAHAA